MVKTDDNNESRVFLHGNHIATVTEDDLILFDGGWQSNTTKSRLNALCDEFCYRGEGVFQKNYKWYVRKFVGKINGESMFKNDEFHSGYKFSEVWLSFTYVHSVLRTTMKKTNEFTVKVQTNNELTEKQIEALIDKMFFSDEKIFYAERISD